MIASYSNGSSEIPRRDYSVILASLLLIFLNDSCRGEIPLQSLSILRAFADHNPSAMERDQCAEALSIDWGSFRAQAAELSCLCQPFGRSFVFDGSRIIIESPARSIVIRLSAASGD
ncbi:hypothetical protein BDW72DRAFT_141913 [Aspergillus terricola var. indicus]